MTLILHDCCLDLADGGLQILSCEAGYGNPVLSTQAQYARWLGPDGSTRDNAELFLRPFDKTRAAKSLNDTLNRFRDHGDAPIVVTCRWSLARLTDVDAMMSVAAAALANGLILALYSAPGNEPAVRLIDIRAGIVRTDSTLVSLAARWQLPPAANAQWLHDDQPQIGGICGDDVLLYSRGYYLLVGVGSGEWDLRLASQTPELCCSAGPYLLRKTGGEESAEYLVDDRLTLQPRTRIRARKRGWVVSTVGAADCPRVAMSHQGGIIEIIDLPSGIAQGLRPFPMAAKNEQLHIALSANGRYLLAQDYISVRVVDLATSRVFELPSIELPEIERQTVSDRVVFRSTHLLRNDAYVVLSAGRLRSWRLADLDWQPLLRPVKARKSRSIKLTEFGLADHGALIESWRRPAVALRAVHRGAKAQSATSCLYGHAELPEGMVWPLHLDVPMMLICQVDLACVTGLTGANHFPASGHLLVFCSVDAEGELVEGRELGTPAELVVLRVTQGAMADQPACSDVPMLKAMKLHAERGGLALPAFDAAIVQLAGWSESELENYRAYVQSVQPESADGGHQFGGYPTLLQQNDLEHIAMASAEQYASDSLADAASWRLLLQLESDQFMWGSDSGILYLMIRNSDLASGDFSAVVALTQGY